MKILIVLMVLIVLAAIFFIVARNGLIEANNRVDEAYSTMDVYLKKRYDLIPNLVNVVKGYAKNEKETLTAVTEASRQAMDAKGIPQMAQSQEKLNQTVNNMITMAQAYPELKSNQNFLDLQNQLKKLEDDIANARKYYNASVREYNNKIASFPGSLFAGGLHYEKKPYFQVSSEAERQNVNVEF